MVSQRGEHHFTVDDQRAVDGVRDIIDVSVIKPRSMLPAYLQLAIYLRGAIIVRQFPPGSALQSEPELVERQSGHNLGGVPLGKPCPAASWPTL
jgi:hypothetical protein